MIIFVRNVVTKLHRFLNGSLLHYFLHQPNYFGCLILPEGIFLSKAYLILGFRSDSVVKEPPANTGDARDKFLSLQKGTATHSSICAWEIPWTEEPGRLQSMGSKELDTT